MKKVITITAIIVLTVLCGCIKDARPRNKSIIVNNRNKWMALAYFTEKYYNTTGWTTEEIAAELTYAEYLIESQE